MYIDTHAHPHMDGYQIPAEEFFNLAKASRVEKVIAVGTSAKDSENAIAFANENDNCFASVGLHPHDSKDFAKEKERLGELAKQPGVVAIGECGLDYYYLHSDKNDQITALTYQIELALENNLPMIFHVRNADGNTQAFDDFFEIIDKYNHISGVVHSFTAGESTMEECVKRGLYIGLNGIMTFSKDESQLEAARSVPLDRLLLETDSPFLTPAPFRGKVNHSGHIKIVAEFLAKLRGEELSDLAKVTSDNAKEVFNL